MKRSKFSEEQVGLCLAPSRIWYRGRGCVPPGRHQRSPRSMRGRRSTRTWGVSELRRLRQLEEENTRLKRLVADLSLDKHMLSEALRKKV